MKKLLLFLSLAFSLNAFSQVPSYVPTSGLVGWWPFTGNAIDSSGNGNNGTTTSGVILTTDRFSNSSSAYSFDGDGDYIDCGNAPSVNITGSLTLSAWIYAIDLSSYNGIISKGYDASAYELVEVESDMLYFLSAHDSFYVVPLFNWIHVCSVFDSTTQTINLYINGVLHYTQMVGYNFISINNENLYLGSHRPLWTTGWTWNGKLDDIGIWNRALDSCEVKDLYFASLGNCSGVGINEVSQSNLFTVYPNPTNSAITINTKANYTSIQIVNMFGQVVFTKEKSASLNVSSLPSGIYFIQLVDNKGSLIGKEKFVKE